MATEQGLYAQVVTILRKESENKKEKENTNKYNTQGKSAISRRWFNLDHEWLEENFRTSEPDSIKICTKQNLGVMIQKHIKYLGYRLVIQKQQENYSSTQQH